jgi:hypothetical protein
LPWCNPYLGSKDAQVALFDDLANRHPELIKKEIAGYSVNGKPIPMYRVGNPLGGKYLFDGAIHGCSDLSTLVHYHFLKWLLESGDERALNILRTRCILAVPILNIDQCVRKNSNGVDLNRNFTYNWSSAGSGDPTSDYYRGTSPASEPETQAIIALFTNEKPEIYINFHNWGGPYLGGRGATSQQQTRNSQIATQYLQLAQSIGVEPYNYSAQGLAAGQASSDAALKGANSFLVELVDMNNNVPPNYNKLPTLEQVETYYWPRAKPLHIALSEACSEGPPIKPKKYVFTRWQDGDTNPTKTINV